MSIRNKIIATIIGLSLVAMLVPSGVAQAALTESQIQAILSLLTSFGADATTVANVDASLRGTTPVIPPTGVPAVCAGVTFTRALAVGSTGSEVPCLKAYLEQVLGTTIGTTTLFGTKTKAAVKQYQTSRGIAGGTGNLGPATRAQLNSDLAGGVVTPIVPVVPTGAGLTVALAVDNPASGTLVSGATSLANAQGAADLAHLTFTNGDNAEVKVTSLSFNRIGISQDTLLYAVYLYQGANRLTDSASVSSGVINFNITSGLFTVPAGGSVTIRVLADLYYGMSGQTVGVSLASATGVTTNASSVKGTFPVKSNLMTTASATLATVNFQASTSTTPTGGNVDPANDYTVWQNLATISTRAVTLSRIALYQTGSALSTDIQNYRLYVDGTQAGSAVAGPDSNGYITFDLSASPVTIQTGTRTIKVVADIIAGSSKTFTYSLRASADAVFTDTQVGVGIQPQVGSSTFAQVRSCYLSATTTYACTINSGTVTFTKKTDSPSGNIVLGAPNAILAKYTLTAAGEPVKITDLYVYISDATSSPAYFRNGALYANGAQIGSTTDIKSNGTSGYATGTLFSLGSSLIVTPGSPVTLEVRADIHELSGTAVASNDSIYAVIVKGSSNAEGRVSKATISTPSVATNGNTLTVKTGTLTLSKYTAYVNQTVVAPVTAYKLAHFTLTNDTVEPVNISAIEADLNYVSSYTTSLYVTYGTQTATVKPTVSATNSWSVNYQLPASATIDVKVFADVSSLMTSGTGQASVEVCGTTASSATAVYTNSGTTCSDAVLGGQGIVFGTGSLTPTVDGSTPVAQIVAGGQTVTAGKFKFTAVSDSYTINELRFTVNANSNAALNSAAITSAVLKDGITPLATATYDSANARFTFTGLTVPVAANTVKSLTLAFNLSSSVSADYSDTNVDVAPTLSYAKVSDSQGTLTYPTCSGLAGNELRVFATVPTLTTGTLSSATAVNGTTAELYKFTIAAGSKGDVAVKQIFFTVLVNDGGTVTSPSVNTFKFFRGSSDITTSVTILNSSAASLEGTTSISSGSGSSTVVVTFGATGNTEEIITAGTSQAYSLKALTNNFYTSDTGNDSVSTYIASDATTFAASLGGYLNDHGANGIYGLASTVGGAETATYNLLWSDVSSVPHSYTIDAASIDWYNGYLVSNLPLDTSAVTAH